ncbi:hypothetical protein G4V62_03725 [Bacillaceae bacterium SIJ1]|uniref:DUF6115 domain-containing protein n=1 Tax=Litoribacterium kuwaitense TaxID=1398745 RepID=UPI0013EAC237|nr:hypothetical protein [Litoribacterium kuwaitense]NGP44102.1 hypothetical protein [Litoribacterium kuwaitense]
MGVWLTISFLLHLLSLFLIIILFARGKSTTSVSQHEMNELLELMDNIQAENEELLRAIKRMPVRSSAPGLDQETKKPSSEERAQLDLYPLREKPAETAVARNEEVTLEAEESSSTYVPPMVEDESPSYTTSPEAKIWQLHNEGMSSDEIARHVNKGKTEVQLILKMKRPLPKLHLQK